LIRFVALAWDRANPLHTAAALALWDSIVADNDRWQIKSRGDDGFCICCITSQSEAARLYEHGAQKWFVLGRLFRRDITGKRSTHALSEAELSSLTRGGSQWLAANTWGSYVAFGHEKDNQRKSVFRSPVTSPLCFETTYRGVTVWFSHMEDCAVAEIPFCVDWDYVAAHLARIHITECRGTGLKEVSLILAGEHVALRAGGRESAMLWNPLSHAADLLDEPTVQIAARLRDAARDCIGTWAACHEHVLLQLSGGFDSSVVLACLRNTHPEGRVTCLNHHDAGANSDERNFARCAARHIGCTLVERERNAHTDLRPILTAERCARPSSWNIVNLVFRAEMELLAAQLGCTAVFSGGGGDELFYKLDPLLAMGDYIRDKGVDRNTLRTAIDVARAADVSVWRALRYGISAGVLRRPSWNQDAERARTSEEALNSFLSYGARTSVASRFVHPYLAERGNLPSGKLHQIHMLCCSLTLDGFVESDSSPEYVDPLRSQPLVELCLRIPSYRTTVGGWDRYVARRAFVADLPPEIATRTGKGGREDHAKAVIFNNLSFIRELLLDGELARHGLLNRTGLERMLSGNPNDIRSYMGDLYECIGTEAWLFAWQRRSRPATSRRAQVA
jgi:asparagine synthase (glutamine-hydrolysing)